MTASSSYKYGKVWRKKHPAKRNEERQKNYAQTQLAKNKGVRWTEADEALIIALDRSIDRELAKTLGRSVQAIQVRRAKVFVYMIFSSQDARSGRLFLPPICYTYYKGCRVM